MLRQIQTRFANVLLDNDGSNTAPISYLQIASRDIVSGALPPDERLAIYRRNVYGNLTSTLREIYPVVLKLVGDAFFTHAARLYIAKYPSTSGDLNDFGTEFAAFLAEYPHARALTYLADVAKLEWHWHTAFHAADTQPMDMARLGVVAEDDIGKLRLALAPSAVLMRSYHPLQSIWLANQPEYEDEAKGGIAIDWEAGEQFFLLHRNIYDVEIRTLSHAQFLFLSQIADGQNLSTCLESAFQIDGQFDLQRFLISCVQSGVIVDFKVIK